MKRLSALGVAVGVVVCSAGVALAAWTIGSIGASGRGAARTLPTGPTPTTTASGSTVLVSFTQVSVGGAVLGSLTGGGYTVGRYSAGGAAQTVLSACNTTLSGSAATLSCSESNVANGTWSYKVTPVLAGWRGIEGTAGSVTVNVDITPPVGLTISGVGTGGNAEILSGTAGTAVGDQQTVTVVVCPTKTFPCNNADAQSIRSVTNGAWTWTTPGIGNKKSHYAQVTQSDVAGNVATAVFGPFTT